MFATASAYSALSSSLRCTFTFSRNFQIVGIGETLGLKLFVGHLAIDQRDAR